MECNMSTAMSTPYLEHFTKGNSYVRECIDPNDANDYVLGGQYHFRVNTKYACPVK